MVTPIVADAEAFDRHCLKHLQVLKKISRIRRLSMHIHRKHVSLHQSMHPLPKNMRPWMKWCVMDAGRVSNEITDEFLSEVEFQVGPFV